MSQAAPAQPMDLTAIVAPLNMIHTTMGNGLMALVDDNTVIVDNLRQINDLNQMLVQSVSEIQYDARASLHVLQNMAGIISNQGGGAVPLPTSPVQNVQENIGAGMQMFNAPGGDLSKSPLLDPKKMKKTSKSMGKIFGSLSGMTAAAGPIGAIIAALQALGFLQPIINVVQALISTFSIGLMPVFKLVIDVLADLIPPFLLLNQAIQPIIQVLADSLAPIFKQLAPLIMASVQVFLPLLDVLLPLISIVVNLSMAFNPVLMLLPVIVPLIEIFASYLTLLLTPLTEVLSYLEPFTSYMSQFTTGLGEGIATITSINIGEKFGEWVDTIEDTMTTKIRSLGDSITSTIGNAFDDAVEGVKDFGLNLATSIKDTITGWFTSG